VVAAIVPWNVPQFLIMPKLIPALIAGCTVIIKPAPETPLDALWLAEMIEQIDLPEGVVSVLPGGTDVGEALVRHPGVDKIAFTGSSAVGRRIATLCGEQLKRVSLELGGKSAAIILDDAAISKTVAGLKNGGLMNNGQATSPRPASWKSAIGGRRGRRCARGHDVGPERRRSSRSVNRHRTACRPTTTAPRPGLHSVRPKRRRPRHPRWRGQPG
jgi:hypothetical protein